MNRMSKHKLIIPETSLEPFTITFEVIGQTITGTRLTSWEPGYPLHSQRDYFIVHELASVLVKKKIIRRKGVDGIQQTRKWIRGNRMPSSYLYKNSKKYGYLIPKKEFSFFYEEMTGGDSFVEEEWISCLLGKDNNEEFIKYKEAEFRRKKLFYEEKLKDPKLPKITKERLKMQIELCKKKAGEYRSKWYKAVFRSKRGD